MLEEGSQCFVGVPPCRRGLCRGADVVELAGVDGLSELTRTYSGAKAGLQSFPANDLLGVAFGIMQAGSGVSYIGYNPGAVSTGTPASLPQPLRAATKAFFTLFATSAPRAIAPMTVLLDDPLAEPFTAHRQKRRLPLDGSAFDWHDAQRLHDITRELIRADAIHQQDILNGCSWVPLPRGSENDGQRQSGRRPDDQRVCQHSS
ncbi:hypothetical protein ABZ297_26420 [Nonomuraea sp. NPDC005983]|uniref:hypothetical protein n=1 Tax=Nonomuraea sp. NPDC005983 TaxID=3155595 RepID=UPI0033A09686